MSFLFTTINIEELPPHHTALDSIQSLLPSSIEEDQDDPRSLLYLFDDNDFERAAAFLALDKARQQAHAAAEAVAVADMRQQSISALASRLRQLLDEDDELVDMLGRRILATRGYQINDLWQPHCHYHRHDPQHYQYDPHRGNGYQQAPASRTPDHEYTTIRQTRFPDVHAAWDGFADQERSLSDYDRASPSIHTAPVLLHGHAHRQPSTTQRTAIASHSAAARPSRSSTGAATQARIAIHPLTGVPMLLVKRDSEVDEGTSGHDVPAMSQGHESDDDDDVDADVDEWAIHDESDLDWLGRELLHRQSGDPVWILGTNQDVVSKPDPIPKIPQASNQSMPVSAPSSAAQQRAQKRIVPATPTLPVHVEEADSDHELASVAGGLNPCTGETGANLSSASRRVAAALAQAALVTPEPAQQAGSIRDKPRRQQRAATVMSESEEEQLETVGRPVESDHESRAEGGDVSSLNDRPRKTVKVVDLREGSGFG
ncbi:uncharacterized protein MEPE_03565 [Melanopsichium pennsylvanicum]|uniref:Uncharacterized protein n=2 Tax=Melanopsichium pennsylvanicum TaxID=63383 RepID=A0AAJ5C5L0_9BASI|nr:putative protein [Melanopsichium pennsylvanicum 4]SNX84856.1 uncharacterized protein MEPE_03565 [Melanopsichium pennsylvanicum]